MRNCFLFACLLFVLVPLGVATGGSAPSGWPQVQGLGPHTRIHIKSDKENAVCFVHFADEQQLTCSRSEAIGSPLLVFPRAEIKSIKLSRKSLGTTINTGYVDDLFDGALIYQRQ
jgi:hypothetical protein